MNDLICSLNRVINAPIEKVFDAWLNPQLLSRFMLPMPGRLPGQSQIDPSQMISPARVLRPKRIRAAF